MEGLGGTGAAGLERGFTASKPVALVLFILRFSLVNSVPDKAASGQLALGVSIRPGRHEGEPTASLRDGRPARTVRCVLPCAAAWPMKTATHAPCSILPT